METPVSRWFDRLVARHFVVGTIVESALLSTWIALLGFIFPHNHIDKIVGFWLVLFVAFVMWFGLYNWWKLGKRP